VRKIYYPLPAFVGVRLLDEEYPDGHEFGLPECPREFACRSCHGVRFFSMTSAGAWNDVILQLSGGLLYGHEVEKPAWWRSEVEKGRKRRFVAKGMRKSERRDEVRGLLLAGLKRREISARLRVARSRVDTLIDQIYKMEGVHSVGELRGRLRTGVVEDTACTGGMPVSR
jgi:DNA-binding CsgD family transcriptional regulator